jgi:hypothetical protein
MKSTTYPVAMPDDLLGEIRRAAEQTKLSMADVIRQSTKLGLPRLREQMSVGRVTNVDPLPDKVARKLYQEREDDMKSIRAFIAAQPKGAQQGLALAGL